ncbi:hypothetical protein, partial [Tepidiforma sp.]|uniref:hypothetical protein n=1 Tax=Tepidiforma sp. TaxID=2682230 RepID=UPI002ADE134E
MGEVVAGWGGDWLGWGLAAVRLGGVWAVVRVRRRAVSGYGAVGWMLVAGRPGWVGWAAVGR